MYVYIHINIHIYTGSLNGIIALFYSRPIVWLGTLSGGGMLQHGSDEAPSPTHITIPCSSKDIIGFTKHIGNNETLELVLYSLLFSSCLVDASVLITIY